MSSESDPIVVTGIGLWTPLAATREASWDALLTGRSALRWLDAARDFPEWGSAAQGQWAGAPAAERPRRAVAATMAVAVVEEALRHAQFDPSSLAKPERRRIGCVFGASKGSFDSLAPGFASSDDGTNTPEESLWSLAPSAPLDAIVQRLHLGGPATCPVAACATGSLAILMGAQWIEQGRCDTVIVGSADAALHPGLLASYRRMGVTARIANDPSTAVRPFDRDRSGFLVGEGAAALILERRSAARSRGATPLAAWGGGILLSDTAGMLSLEATGHTVRDAIARLPRGGSEAVETGREETAVDLVSLHGTATRENDSSEGRGLRAALGDWASPKSTGASGFSLKGAIGHLLGGAGSVETAAAILALRDQIVPPTANLDAWDPDCGFANLSQQALRRPLRSALKLSLGFGGHVCAICFRLP